MYVYIDMHQAINSALVTANKFLEKHKWKTWFINIGKVILNLA
jgi:hypothetical protein